MRDNIEDIDDDQPQHDIPESEIREIQEANHNYIEEETLLDDNTGIRFAPCEGEIPKSILLDTNCEEMAFPGIWGGHSRSCKEGLRMSYQDHIKSELRRKDRRAAKPDHLLFVHKVSTLKQLAANRAIIMRKAGQRTEITAQQAANGDFINNVVARDNAFRFMASITGTPAYWESKKKDVLTMVRQKGNFTLFITMSMAETHWYELLVILKKTVDGIDIDEETAKNMTFEEKSRLIREDPITCALYFEHRIAEIRKTWSHPDGPFGRYEIIMFFYRIEFQHRGSPHIHMVIWLKNAPKYDPTVPASNNAVCEFIDQIITTQKIHGDVNNDKQIHKCTFTCYRKKNGKKICRFGAPFLPMDQTRILEPIPNDYQWQEGEKLRIQTLHQNIVNLLESSSETIGSFNDMLSTLNCSLDDYLLAAQLQLICRKVFYKREPNACRINCYSPKILCLLRANMDIQFVVDAYACIGYIVDYINKASKGLSRLLRLAVEDVKRGNHTIKEKLSKLSHVLFNCAEVCAQEAAYCRLNLPMSRMSTAVQFIPTGPIEVRFKLLYSLIFV